MRDSSIGAVVPAMKKPEEETTITSATTTTNGDIDAEAEVADKELLCPICMQMIKDAFLTACGHSFCYMCIVTHLRNKSDCPCCFNSLTPDQLFPNFLLDKLLKKTSALQLSKNASPVEQFRQSLEQGCEVSIKELDTLLSLLAEKKRKMEQEEAERNMQILLDFLHSLRKQKVNELNEVQNDIQYVKEDINAVERHRIELYRARDKYSVKLRLLGDDPLGLKSPTSSNRISTSHLNSGNERGNVSEDFLHKKVEGKAQHSFLGPQRKDTSSSGPTSQHLSQSGLAVKQKKRVHSQFNDLQEFYLQKRRQSANHLSSQGKNDKSIIHREGYNAGLADVQSVLSTFTRYSRLRVIAELRHGDLFHSTNIVSSIEFDRDDELFATAGVSRCIKVFDFSSGKINCILGDLRPFYAVDQSAPLYIFYSQLSKKVVNEHTDVHCPVVEMSTRSKLSCLSWNKYSKNLIASSDYEGIVTIWDVTTRQSLMEYEEHEKRAWSVDFSRTEPSMLVSGSDDCKVKVWCTKQEACVLNIDLKANICCVKYNPESSLYVAVGSADHHIHYYDLRNTCHPIHVFSGHRKAVSYVKFLSDNELASASTDSTLRLWDVKENSLVRTFRGHTNEKNFVGLTVNKDFLACGSETNEVCVYHKALARPMTSHKFGSPDTDETDEDAGSYFISAVCWKSESPTMLAANSQGTIKVLVLAA